MKAFLQITIILGIACVAFGWEYAWCQFQGTNYNPTLTGYAYFETGTNAGEIQMTVEVSGITQNLGTTHGIHIHEFGDLSDKAAASSVGSHWNPYNASHGCEESTAQWHAGDTGNWYVNNLGYISDVKTLTVPTLSGLYSIIGRAVVIHNRTDDCNSTGSSQARLGFCVIGIGNPSLSVGHTSDVNNASNGASSIPIGVCDLQPIGDSGVSGRVWFTPVSNGLKVDAFVNNLTGTHGFHIHEFGDLRANTSGNSTGGHYNPYNASHGIPPFSTRHLGDLGNIYHTINSSTLAYSYTVLSNDKDAPKVALTGLYNIIGRGLVIHSQPDNCSQPTGGSGSRLAFCVIGIGNVTTTSPMSLYTSVPTTQDDSLCGGDEDSSNTESLISSASLVFWALMALLF